MNENEQQNFSPDEVAELRDIALQQRISQAGRDKDTYLSTGGMTAHDTLAAFDKGQKSVDEFASKLFGGDSMRMARYRNAVSLSRATTRKHLQSLADTEARQSAIASQKMTNDADLAVKLDSHVLEMSTVTCAQDQVMNEQSEISTQPSQPPTETLRKSSGRFRTTSRLTTRPRRSRSPRLRPPEST